DPSATDKPLATALGGIEHASLPRRHPVLATSELDRDAVPFETEVRWLQRPARSDPCEDLFAALREVPERLIAEPVPVTKLECARTQSFPRTDHHLAAGGVELQHIERLLGRHADPFALTDRVIDDAAVAAEHPSIDVDDIAGLGGARAQALDHLRVPPGRHEA